jgi:hypothetical protein
MARIERVAYILQQEVVAKQELAGNDAVVRSLAELKQIRAVLAGVLVEAPTDALPL